MSDDPTGFDRRLLGAEPELYALGSVSEDLPALATDALVQGLDSPTLRVLAGEPSSMFNAQDNRDLFREALKELGRDALPHSVDSGS